MQPQLLGQPFVLQFPQGGRRKAGRLEPQWFSAAPADIQALFVRMMNDIQVLVLHEQYVAIACCARLLEVAAVPSRQKMAKGGGR